MSMLNITHFPVNKITENRGYYGEWWYWFAHRGSYLAIGDFMPKWPIIV